MLRDPRARFFHLYAASSFVWSVSAAQIPRSLSTKIRVLLRLLPGRYNSRYRVHRMVPRHWPTRPGFLQKHIFLIPSFWFLIQYKSHTLRRFGDGDTYCAGLIFFFRNTTLQSLRDFQFLFQAERYWHIVKTTTRTTFFGTQSYILLKECATMFSSASSGLGTHLRLYVTQVALTTTARLLQLLR